MEGLVSHAFCRNHDSSVSAVLLFAIKQKAIPINFQFDEAMGFATSHYQRNSNEG